MLHSKKRPVKLTDVGVVYVLNWDNYFPGADEAQNGSKGVKVCIIVVKSMKIFGQKCPLSLTHLNLHVFFESHSLFSISNH